MLRLVKHGVPFHEAFALSPVRRTAYLIVFGEIDGHAWDYVNHRWKDPA